MPTTPQPKLPNLNLPAIRNLPTIPHVGCSPGDGNSYAGRQFGNAPDLNSILQIKGQKKSLEEQIYALIQGELGQIPRAPIYAARAAQLTDEVAELVDTMTSIVDEVTNNVNDSIAYIDQQIATVDQAKNALLAIPAGARSAVDRLMIERYGRYAGELNAQKTRLQSTLDCLAA
jgi:hypothetical protein